MNDALWRLSSFLQLLWRIPLPELLFWILAITLLCGGAAVIALFSNERNDPSRRTLRVYSQTRLSLAVISPGFVTAGVLGLLGFGQVRVNGQVAEGDLRVLSEFFFIVLGILFGVLRLTLFRSPRGPD